MKCTVYSEMKTAPGRLRNWTSAGREERQRCILYCHRVQGKCTIYSVHCTVYTVQCTVYIIQCKEKNAQFTVYIVQIIFYYAQLTLYSVHWFSVQCTMYNEHYKVYSVQHTVIILGLVPRIIMGSTLGIGAGYTPEFTIHCTMCTVHCTLYTGLTKLYTL